MDSAKLTKDFPTLRVRNRTADQQHILYVDESGQPDSITINGYASRPIPSKGLLQIPDAFLFELVSPTLFELQKAGVIEFKSLPNAEAPAAPEPEPPKEPEQASRPKRG